MKISLNWLSDFIEWSETDPHKIAEIVTASIAEVDEVEQQGALLDHCCVGEVLKLSKHPDADKLQLCDVQTDKGKKRVVCGGTNLSEGMQVAFAHVGATVASPDGSTWTIEKASIRGESSEGMICAAEELLLEEQFPAGADDGNRPVIVLPGAKKVVGTPLAEFLGRTDTILHIDNHAITHRADLFSHIGFARECVALGLGKWKKDPILPVPEFTKDDFPFTTHNDCPESVPRYVSCMIQIDELGETPDWMKARLEATGWRPLHLPIDITNYVLMEVGSPLHSFDADDFEGDIRVRLTGKGESIQTLDKTERELPERAIVISDDAGIFDLLGVMGGLRSSTKDTTKNIFLHSAVLDPYLVRKTIQATGLRTDASTVFEKGVPEIVAVQGFFRAVELFLELVPGARITSTFGTWGEDPTPGPIDLPLEYVSRMIGKEIPGKEVKRILEALEFTVEEGKEVFRVTPPVHRVGDIEGKHDLMEEVARIHGYANIEPALPFASIAPPARDQRMHQLRDALKDQGFFELLPLSLVGPDLLERTKIEPSQAPELENPLGLELSLMAPSTLPGLLRHAESQLQNTTDTHLQTFTLSRVFGKKEENDELGMLIAAKDVRSLSDDPFLHLKRAVEQACGSIGHALTVSPAKVAPPFAHPGRAAVLVSDGTPIGLLYEVHPSVRLTFDLPDRTAALQIDVRSLLGLPSEAIVAEGFPEYPEVTYDHTATFDHHQSIAEVLEKIRESSPLLESVQIADLYSGEPLEKHQYNLTVRCTYRAPDRTLTEEEVKEEFAKVERLLV